MSFSRKEQVGFMFEEETFCQIIGLLNCFEFWKDQILRVKIDECIFKNNMLTESHEKQNP